MSRFTVAMDLEEYRQRRRKKRRAAGKPKGRAPGKPKGKRGTPPARGVAREPDLVVAIPLSRKRN